MTPHALQNITKFEDSLWEAADQLRANSKLTSSEYCMPILGIIFLRHATNRYNAVLKKIEEEKAAGKLPKGLPITKAHFISRRALMLPKEARYDELVKLPQGTNLGAALVEAMNAVERDFEPLQNQLPKDYEKFDNSLLEAMLRIFDSEALRSATGDVFGRIYEYFLMKFAIQGAQDNGEFFTPPSIVQTIVNIIEPDHGVVFDPACGSGGMFVQSSHFMEEHGQDTMKRVTFYGQEKTATTIRLAKMNLAVHGLEGEIMEANTFYQDEHRLSDGRPLWGNCDFVMANPPFNVDMVDADRIKGDRRLPFGLPGVNKKTKVVSNGNYLWISYFHSYLGPEGRAGFVMSSQASSAGHGEAELREKIVKTGEVDVMVAIRPNFFYTRSVPCELWFFDKGKPEDRRDQVLMLDARHVYRKVTRKIYDFTPEQQKNLASIVWLHRGQRHRFARLVWEHRRDAIMGAAQAQHALAYWLSEDIQPKEPGYLVACLNKFTFDDYHDDAAKKAEGYSEAVAKLKEIVAALKEQPDEIHRAAVALNQSIEAVRESAEDGINLDKDAPEQNAGRIASTATRMDAVDEQAAAFRKAIETFAKGLRQGADLVEKQLGARRSESWKKSWEVSTKLAKLETAVEQFRNGAELLRYFLRHVHWLLQRFPEARYADVAGLCKVVTSRAIEAADWSLTPGRFVGVAPSEEDEHFDFVITIKEIHTTLGLLNKEAADLAARIQTNLEGLAL